MNIFTLDLTVFGITLDNFMLVIIGMVFILIVMGIILMIRNVSMHKVNTLPNGPFWGGMVLQQLIIQ